MNNKKIHVVSSFHSLEKKEDLLLHKQHMNDAKKKNAMEAYFQYFFFHS